MIRRALGLAATNPEAAAGMKGFDRILLARLGAPVDWRGQAFGPHPDNI
ncbi:hypothetical protein [Afifella aestuarii]|nr:hypothetical protein [Afifella aestuarii]